jgi:Ras-related protein Rab-18
MPTSAEYDFNFKILIVGDAGVGKSSLLLRYCDDKFTDKTSSTIGVDFKAKMLQIHGKTIKLSIWDTAGQEKFRTLTSSYYRNAHGVMLMYDATNRDSFNHMSYWLQQVSDQSTYQSIVKMVIGNKLDYPLEEIQVDRTEGEVFALEHSCLFEEISSKNNFRVSKCFDELVLSILDQPNLCSSARPHKPNSPNRYTSGNSGFISSLISPVMYPRKCTSSC